MNKIILLFCLIVSSWTAGAQYHFGGTADEVDWDELGSRDGQFYQTMLGDDGKPVGLTIGGFSAGKKEGEFLFFRMVYDRRWSLIGIENYSHGVPDGYWEHSDLGSHEIGYYKNGKKEGMWIFDQTSDVPGELEHIEYRRGVRHGKYESSDQFYRKIGNYKNDMKSGTWVESYYDIKDEYGYKYGKDAESTEITEYRKGIKHGKYERITSFISPAKETGRYKRGEKHGTWRVYLYEDENGELTKVNGEWMESKREIYRNGKLIETIEREPEIIEIEF
jgi:hypothetical protein